MSLLSLYIAQSDEQKLEAFQMSCLHVMSCMFGLRWFDFVSNASVMNQTQQQNPQQAIHYIGSLCRLHGSVPAHGALRLTVDDRTADQDDRDVRWVVTPSQAWVRPSAESRCRALC